MPIDSLHNGHRNRLRGKYLNNGPDALSDHELIELLLFYSKPRVNTNDTAHAIINELGSLDEVFSADIDRLKLIDGVGDSSALLLSLVGSIHKRLSKKEGSARRCYDLNSTCDLLIDHFAKEKTEHLVALFFDADMKFTSMSTISRGISGSSATSPAEIARLALLKRANGVIISHNHPSGSSLPSSSDRNFTHIVEASLFAVDVTLVDHIIISGDNYTSVGLSGTVKLCTTKSNGFSPGALERFFKNAADRQSSTNICE